MKGNAPAARPNVSPLLEPWRRSNDRDWLLGRAQTPAVPGPGGSTLGRRGRRGSGRPRIVFAGSGWLPTGSASPARPQASLSQYREAVCKLLQHHLAARASGEPRPDSRACLALRAHRPRGRLYCLAGGNGWWLRDRLSLSMRLPYRWMRCAKSAWRSPNRPGPDMRFRSNKRSGFAATHITGGFL